MHKVCLCLIACFLIDWSSWLISFYDLVWFSVRDPDANTFSFLAIRNVWRRNWDTTRAGRTVLVRTNALISSPCPRHTSSRSSIPHIQFGKDARTMIKCGSAERPKRKPDRTQLTARRFQVSRSLLLLGKILDWLHARWSTRVEVSRGSTERCPVRAWRYKNEPRI